MKRIWKYKQLNHAVRLGTILAVALALVGLSPGSIYSPAHADLLVTGYHDGEAGDVRSWACNAGGWAMDPDDPDQDVPVRILVDDDLDPVLEVLADTYREDLEGACTDGTCAFNASLWDSITHNEPHMITVEAQDLQSEEWYPLNATPKPLTCWGLPEGHHDYDGGDVPNFACNAGGWAMDPDRPGQDVTVRILVDGDPVVEVLAENYREDLEIAWNEGTGGCPGGTCAFERSLWDLLIPYETHEITAEAWDTDTDAWYPLNATPKTLTCRSYDIYAYDTLTGETEQITALADSHEYNPRWSPDNKRIVHDRLALDWSANLGVHITEVKTGISAPLAGAENGNYPTWSPNGQWIAFNEDDSLLYIVPPSGGEPTLVRDDAFMASWAPNSRRLSFHEPSSGAIRTVDLNGDDVVTVVDDGSSPAWSPDGKWIAFEVNDGELWKVGVDNRGAPLGEPIQLTSGPAWRPSWSADDKTIAFHAGYNGEDTDIWTIPAVGGTAIRLTGGADFGDYDPNYSNNGRYISYSGYMPLYPPPLYLRVNYGHDWVESFYPAGHKVWLKVTDSDGETVKATATLVTEPKDFWGGETGFQTQPEDWEPSPPDIQPGDWVIGRVDNGVTAQVQIGDIDGVIDLETDSIEGTIDASWFSEEVNVECFPWGAPEPQPDMKYDSVLPDGIDTYSCSWDHETEWDIQYYQDVGVGYFGPDGHWVANAFFVKNPHFTVFPEWEAVEGWEWPLDAAVHLTIDDPATPESPDHEQDEMVVWTPWDPNQTWVWFDFAGSYDVKPGDLVTLADGVTTREHTVQNLAITTVDADEDTVTGTADAYAEVFVWPHATGEQIPATADAEGTWEVNFSGVFDLVPGECGRSQIYDEMGNGTAVDWCVPNTRFTVWPQWNYLEGYEWPDGALVAVSVAGKEACYTEATAGYPEWDPGNTFFSLNFPEGCAIEANDEITVSSDTLSLMHVVQSLAVTAVDMEDDTVAGTAIFDPELYMLHTWIHDVEGSYMQLNAPDGTWLVNFGSLGFDLQPGMGGRVELVDQSSNATAAEWWIPNPVFTAFPEQEAVEGWEWPLGEVVHLTIDDPATIESPDHEQNGTVILTPWDSGQLWVWFDFAGSYDMKPGDLVTLTDGVTTREHTVRNLTITTADADTDIVAGTADPGAEVFVWPHATGQQNLATADDVGNWQADFTGVFDLVPDECGRAEIRDEVGNSTAVDWCVPSPP